MKIFNYSLLCVVMFLAGCKNEPVSPEGDELIFQSCEIEEIGILGEWEFEKRFYDGIANAAAECCEFLEFEKNTETDTCAGFFRNNSLSSPEKLLDLNK